MRAFEIALSEYGEREIKGALHNARILQYSKDIGIKWVKDDETAWCAIFTGWCLYKAGLPTTGNALARSYLKYGAKTTVPEIGDLVILWRISPTSDYGHVGFFIKKDKKYVWILGGNQNDEVNITKFSVEQLLEYRTVPRVKNA
ncbi:MAG: TIGR02594 family protein [Chitinophagales bacterium]|nr:TIGR02594 family protein [Chitinophagales bacterium]